MHYGNHDLGYSNQSILLIFNVSLVEIVIENMFICLKVQGSRTTMQHYGKILEPKAKEFFEKKFD